MIDGGVDAKRVVAAEEVVLVLLLDQQPRNYLEGAFEVLSVDFGIFIKIREFLFW